MKEMDENRDIAEKIKKSIYFFQDEIRMYIEGSNEFVIENHTGIEIFDDKHLLIKGRKYKISIEGRNFEIAYMGGSTLIIKGVINSINFLY